jgi:cytochrome c oxidase cbb3-type subunit 1
MDPFVRRFIKSSLAWLAGGVILGVAMIVQPIWIIYRPAHLHMTLLGFVTMMIFGLGYHLLPRVGGSPLKWKWLAMFHLWIANAGLALMVAGFFLRPSYQTVGPRVLLVGGTLSAIGALSFVINIWKTLDAGIVRLAAMQRARPLPTRDS